MVPVDDLNQDTRRARVFLSYSRKDSAFIARLASALIARGYLADFDNSNYATESYETGIAAEDEWWARLQEMITLADIVVFVVSPDSAGSPVCDEEIAHARSMGKRIVPVMWRAIDFSKAPPRLAALNIKISFEENDAFSAALEELIQTLERDVAWYREATGLAVAASEWQSSGRIDDALLHGAEISDAEAWSARRPTTAPAVSEMVLSFLAESRAAETRRLEKERRALARQTRLQTWVGGLVLVAFVVTLAGAALVVIGQRSIGYSRSQMFALASERFYAEEDYVRAMRLAVLAARENWLSPAVPNARNLLATSANANVLLGDIPFGKDKVLGAWLSSDGSRVLTWGESGAAQIWDAATGVEIGKPMVHPTVPGWSNARNSVVSGAEVNSSEELMLTWSKNGLVQLWNFSSQNPIGTTLKHNDVMGAKFSDNGLIVATWGKDGFVRLWNIAGARLGNIPLPDKIDQSGVAFSTDSKKIVVWTTSHERREFVAQAWTVFAPVTPVNVAVVHPYGDFGVWGDDGSYASQGAIFSGDGSRLLTWTWGLAHIQIFAEPSGFTLKHAEIDWEDGPALASVGANWAKNDELIVTWSADQTAKLWDSVSGAQVGSAFAHDSEVRGAALTADGETLLSWTQNGSAQIWNVRQDPRVARSLQNVGRVTGARFSADGARILTWTDTGSAQVWDTESGSKIGPVFRHEDRVRGSSFSSDGLRVLTWGFGGARTWTAAGGSQIGPAMVYAPKFEYVSLHAEYSSDGRSILTEGSHGVKLWDSISGKELLAFKADSASFSPDSKLMLSIERENVLRVWNTMTREEVIAPIVYGSPIHSAVFSPDSTQVLLTAKDQSLQIWDVATGTQRAKREAGEPLRNAMYSLDGMKILSQFDGGEVQEWDAKTLTPTGSKISADQFDEVSAEPDGTWPRSDRDRAKESIAKLEKSKFVRALRLYLPNVEDVTRDHKRAIVATSNTAEIFDLTTGQRVGSKMEQPDLIEARFSPDESKVITWGTEYDGSVRQFDVSWTRPRKKNIDLSREVCSKLLSRRSVEAHTDAGLDDMPREPVRNGAGKQILSGLARIDAADIEAAPILEGQAGEDVCGTWTWWMALRSNFSLEQ